MSSKPRDLPHTAITGRAELVSRVRMLGHTHEAAAGHVEALVDLLCEGIASGQAVKLRGFGRFECVRRSERPGRDLRTGESIPVAARNTVVFRPSQSLRKRLTDAHLPAQEP